MSDKQQLNLFRIYPKVVKAIAAENNYNEEKLGDTDLMINYIIDVAKAGRKPTLLKLDDDIESHFKPFKIRTYFCEIPTEFHWHRFFQGHLVEGEKENEKFLNFKKTKHGSILCFIYNVESIYVFTGGLGSTYVKNFVDDEFGIEVVERISKEEDLKLHMARNSSFTGNVSEGRTIYRGPQEVFNEDRSGKTYSEIAGSVIVESLGDLKKLIFDLEDGERVSVKAKSSITFSKSISLKEVKAVIKFLDTLPKDKHFRLSKLRQLKNRRESEKVKINLCELELSRKMFDLLRKKIEVDANAEDSDLFEIASGAQRFYDCTKLVVKRLGKNEVCTFDSPFGITADQVISAICSADEDYLRAKFEEFDSERKKKVKQQLMLEIVSRYSISCFEDEEYITEDKLLKLVACEIRDEDEGKSYFQLLGKWLYSAEKYLTELDNELGNILVHAHSEFPLKFNWGDGVADDEVENENTYIEHVLAKSDKKTIIMHKVIPGENFELCDIMFITKDELILIHVKPSFDGAVRILEKQVSHSSTLISEDLRTNAGLLKAFYKKATGYRGASSYFKDVKRRMENYSEEEFLKLFRKKIIFCPAIVDPGSDRDLKNIKDFRSIVAKMSFVTLFKEIRRSSIPNSDIRFAQIRLKK